MFDMFEEELGGSMATVKERAVGDGAQRDYNGPMTLHWHGIMKTSIWNGYIDRILAI